MIGLFVGLSRKFLAIQPYVPILFYLVLAVYLVFRLPSLLSPATLATQENGTTVITLDLLQALAFLIAWTALLFAIFRVAGNAWVLIEQKIHHLSLRLEQTLSLDEKERSVLWGRVQQIEEDMEETAAESRLLEGRNAELENENKRLTETLTSLRSKFY